MSILINKDTKVITQGITGKTGQFHTHWCREYANGKNAFVAGVHPKKAGENFEGVPIFGTVKDAKAQTGATVSVIYVPRSEEHTSELQSLMRISYAVFCLKKKKNKKKPINTNNYT